MNVSAAQTISQFEKLLGSSAVIADPAKLAPYAIGNLTPGVALQPDSAQEIVEIVKFCAGENLAIVPCGARTKLAMGLPPRRYDVALDLTRLNRVAAYDPGDLTLSVESGVTLADLQQALAKHGQMLPLGAPFSSRATVGGTIASGIDGPLRQLYGTARDFVLGMEFVTGDGVAGKSGGRVVKNVTGYDLHKPLIGSLGTLAVITKINFRTFPAPESIHGCIAHFHVVEDAACCRDKLAASNLRPLTFDILSPGIATLFESEVAARIEKNAVPAGIFSRTEWSVSVGFAGNPEVLSRCEKDFRAMAQAAGATGFVTLGAGSAPSKLAGAFGRKREFIPIALESSPGCTILKISVLGEHIEHALAAAKHAAEDHSLPWAAVARGVGVIYLALLPTSIDEHSMNCVISASKRIQQDCARLDGHCTIPWSPATWKSALNVWGAPREDFALMRKLKNVFDPRGILAPGRFVGGI